MDNEAQPIEVPITITSKPDAAITRKKATKRKAASTKVTPKKGTKAKTVAKKKVKKAVVKVAAKKDKAKPKVTAKGKARKPATKSGKKTTGNKVGRPQRYLGDAQRQMRTLYATGLTLDGVGKKMKPSCTGQCVRHIFIRNGWKLRAKGYRFPKKTGKK